LTGSRAREFWDETRWGAFVTGSGAFLVAAGFTGIILSLLSDVLYAPGQPTDAAGYIQLFSQHQLLAFSDWTIRIIGDFWLVPASIAVYLALRRINRPAAVVGTLLSLAYIIYDVNVTATNSLNLVRLADGYASAATAGLKANYVAAATAGVNALPFQTFFSFAIGAVGWLLWSLIMARSFFGKWSAIFGVVANLVGLLGGAGALVQGTPYHLLGVFTTFGAIATALWFIFVGVRLFRHGNHLRKGERPIPY